MKQTLTLLPFFAVLGFSPVANAQASSQTKITPQNMWQQQESMVSELQAMGLVDSTTHTHDEHDGMGGGNDEDELYISSEDEIAQKIQLLSQQAQQKEDKLAMLAQKLSTNLSTYQNTVTITNGTFNSFGNNSVGAGLLAVRPISSAYRQTSGFGYRSLMGTTRMHKGVDFGAPIGTPIYATGAGVVIHSGPGTGYGRYVEIDHGNGYTTRYAHTSQNYVNVGDRVEVNQRIAAVGNEGRSTGPHLHYEVRQNGMAVNPQTYLALAPAR